MKHLSIKELQLEVELRSFHCIVRFFLPTKEAPVEILCSVTLDSCKSHFSSVPKFVAVGEKDNELLMSEDLTLLLTLKPLSLDSDTDLDTSVEFLWKGKSNFL